MRPKGPLQGPCWVYLFNSQWNDLHSSCWSIFLTPLTLCLETGHADFGGGPFLLRLSHSLECAGALLWRDGRKKPHLTSPSKPWMIPPFVPPGPMGTRCGWGPRCQVTVWHVGVGMSSRPPFSTSRLLPSWMSWWGRGGRWGLARDAVDPHSWVSPRDLWPDHFPARLPQVSPLVVSKQPRSSWPFAVAAGHPFTPSRGRAGRLPVCGGRPKASQQGSSPAAPPQPLPPPLSLPGSHLLQSYLGKLVLSWTYNYYTL